MALLSLKKRPLSKTARSDSLRDERDWLALLGITGIICFLIVATHPSNAVISFDEGFHGGAVLYAMKAFQFFTHANDPNLNPNYLYEEFKNGIVLYPPLWTIIAASLGLIAGPSLAVFRSATLLFYGAAIFYVFWFVKNAHSRGAAFASAFILMSMPMIVIYSHLMMLEVPLLLSITYMVGSFYLVTENRISRTVVGIILLTFGYFVAPLSKLPAFPIAWVICLVYAVAGSVLFYKQKFYRRFWRWEILLFITISFVSIAGFIQFEKHYFHVNMIDFFVAQSSENAPTRSIFLSLFYSIWNNKYFYLHDFLHIPYLAIIWFVSLIGYAWWRKSSLSLLLIVWTLAIYASFSAVIPHVAQYIIPLYAPLAIATALFIAEVTQFTYLVSPLISLAALTLGIVICQLLALPYSESYGWRSFRTGQETAARYIASQATPKDRVIAWHDGTIFALRLQQPSPSFQILHGVPQACSAALQDSFEWAVTTNEPPYPSVIDYAVLSSSPWKKVTVDGEEKITKVYKNTQTSTPQTAEAEYFNPSRSIDDQSASNKHALLIKDTFTQPSFWGCPRLLYSGTNEVTFWLKTRNIPQSIPDSQNMIVIYYQSAVQSELSKRVVTAGELRKASDYTPFQFIVEHKSPDIPGDFLLSVYWPVTLLLDKVTIMNLPPSPLK